MTCPCKVCEERYLGCHAKCDEYQAWHEEQGRKRGGESRRREDLLDDFRTNAIRKTRRKRK